MVLPKEAAPCFRPPLFDGGVCGKRKCAPPSAMAFIINGKHIGDEILEDEFESIKEHYQSMGEVVCCDRDTEFRTYARDNVVNRTLLEQESVKRYGEVTDEVAEARFEEIKAEHGDEQKFYDNTGFNPGDRRIILEKLKSSMIVDRLFEAELQLPVDPADEELEAYYQANLSRYMSTEEVRVSQIFIEPSSHEAAREAYLALRELRREIFAGKDFELAAREHGSEDREIDLGFMKQGETMPEVEAITFSMEVGEISPIVATHYGFHLFKLTDRKEPAPIPREEIPGLRDQYMQEKRALAIEELIDKLKATGSIEEIAETAAEN
jgi:parvulin-like peptidyl-prolyl isomerase